MSSTEELLDRHLDCFSHLAVMTAKLCGPGGVRTVIVENLLLKQLIVLRRARQRAPNLALSDRLICGLGCSSSVQDESERSPHAVDLRRRTHGRPCGVQHCALGLPLPGPGPAPSGGLMTNSRPTAQSHWEFVVSSSESRVNQRDTCCQTRKKLPPMTLATSSSE